MDPKTTGVLLSLTEFKGVNTNAPRGTVPAPELLQNVHLDRTGGYTPMPGDSYRQPDVRRAWASGAADALFLEKAAGIAHFDPRFHSSSILSGVIAGTADTVGKAAVQLLPNLLLAGGGTTYVGAASAEPIIEQTPEIGAPGVGALSWEYTSGLLDAARTYEFVFEMPATSGRYRSPLRFLVGAGHGTPPAQFGLAVTAHVEGTWYYRDLGNMSAYVLLGHAQAPGSYGLKADSGAELHPGYGNHGSVYPNFFEQAVSAYHAGRVFLSGLNVMFTSVQRFDPSVNHLDSPMTSPPNRVWFSDVIASAHDGARPVFSLLRYVDVPLRASRAVVALAAVGSYLYVFGERELWVMTGDPERDARLDLVGDSIGAVNAASVQQLGGTVYWLSDSGALAVQGASVREVGEPVRDQLLILGAGATATVDFGRECYYLTNGVTALCYHAREQGWTSRQLIGPGSRYVYGGGTPYMVRGGALFSIGGEAGIEGTPGRLPMRVRFPHYELGDWRTRKSFNGLAFGLDLATQYAIVTHLSTVDGRIDQTADTVQTVTAGKAGAVRLHTAQDGVNFSGAAISIELEVETQDSRGILRPPLTVYGTVTGEEMWTDDAE